MSHLCILLPWPPSLNGNWRSVRGRVVKSKTYKGWLMRAGWAIQQQKPFVDIMPPLSVEIALGPPDRRKRDLDNLIKPILDLCCKHGLMQDDCDVHRLLAYWCRDIDNGARVEITSI